jgi:hypothetical protein
MDGLEIESRWVVKFFNLTIQRVCRAAAQCFFGSFPELKQLVHAVNHQPQSVAEVKEHELQFYYQLHSGH